MAERTESLRQKGETHRRQSQACLLLERMSERQGERWEREGRRVEGGRTRNIRWAVMVTSCDPTRRTPRWDHHQLPQQRLTPV